MATAIPDYFCHKCQVHIGHVTNFQCPHCRDTFIEEIASQHTSSHSRIGQPRNHGRAQFHGSTPFGSTTIFIGGGHPSNNANQTNNPDIGNFFQTVFTQLAGGPQFPFGMQNSGGGGAAGYFDPTNLDAFLTQFLNQMGDNGGPAPASENRINTIPTVKVTAAQASDSLQCSICMDDFKENDQAKRLPCSHHFHEECISRWLRMHGTCPTCRVTLDGDNTSNREYYNFFPSQDQSSSMNANRRNDGGNNGSSSAPGSTLFDFD
ncbi:unnamed protein product [Rotaria magnacalcarata]|uniref:RING-type E3 ubiquitin transferase n=2 Tax=Rotaria magnacalcarata TaxID=392030 RepID=A0A816Q6D4_9BILA|nr:unnamed protein product [Rotaria magnacalcarata]CAF1624920.1 unnamed protein product [Rotaria magnacalcarata]CAF2056750.1 unnamed protein product [Rotaria magnacalcarata]CAF2140435.1 unnamed protein product [Rotaria magnacalcarata]CAF2164250.1 unnamed protein product [Rotaria magnacalcarata]